MPQIHEHLVSLYPPCFYCRHLLNLGTQEPDLRGWTCKAYPQEIPYGILARHTPHTEVGMVQEGDYVFESEPEELPGETGLWVMTFGGEWKRA